MGVTLVVVRHLVYEAITFTLLTESFCSPDRMVTFSVALLLFCFVVSNRWTQLVVALTSFPLLTFTASCLWMCWISSSDWGTIPARLDFLLNLVVESLRIRTPVPVQVRPGSRASDDGSSRHLPNSSQGNVSV